MGFPFLTVLCSVAYYMALSWKIMAISSTSSKFDEVRHQSPFPQQIVSPEGYAAIKGL